IPSLSAAARAPAGSREAIAVISPDRQCFIAGMNLVRANFDVPRTPQRTLLTCYISYFGMNVGAPRRGGAVKSKQLHMSSDLSLGNASKPPKDGRLKLRRQNFT